MIYLLNYKFKEGRLVYLALSDLFGIGISTAKQICNELSIPLKFRMLDLSPSHLQSLSLKLRSLTIEVDLHRHFSDQLVHLKRIRSSRILKHAV